MYNGEKKSPTQINYFRELLTRIRDPGRGLEKNKGLYMEILPDVLRLRLRIPTYNIAR